jgi:hypothetical protein
MGESSKRITDEELADRATNIYQLISDLPYEDACRVINAVLTANLEVHVPVARPVVAELGDECVHFGIENREAGPSQSTWTCGPDLKQIPLHVPNKLPVLGYKIDVGSVERMDRKIEQREGRDLNSLRWEGRLDSGVKGKPIF